MKRIGNFFRSLLPFLLVIALQVVVTVAAEAVAFLTSGGRFTDLASAIAAGETGVSLAALNFSYGIVAIFVFGFWYRGVFVRPFRGTEKADRPTGFSFHSFIALLFLGIGLYYVTELVVSVAGTLFPAWLADYTVMMEDIGYSNPSVLLILYTVLLSPIVEELAFRGLTFRYARQALPFWLANIWQALLFALLHGDMMQGLYAFIAGLFFGWVVHRGQGIRYSVVLHIVFNAIGMWFSGLISLTLWLNYVIAMLCGIALTIFAMWLFWSDFNPRRGSRRRDRDARYRRRTP